MKQRLGSQSCARTEGDDRIVVLEGEVQIVANAGRPAAIVIATYEPGGFLGEIGLLTGQPAFLAAGHGRGPS